MPCTAPLRSTASNKREGALCAVPGSSHRSNLIWSRRERRKTRRSAARLAAGRRRAYRRRGCLVSCGLFDTQRVGRARQPVAPSPIHDSLECWPVWRNGRRDRLKIGCPQGRVGSSPTTGTTEVGMFTRPRRRSRSCWPPRRLDRRRDSGLHADTTPLTRGASRRTRLGRSVPLTQRPAAARFWRGQDLRCARPTSRRHTTFVSSLRSSLNERRGGNPSSSTSGEHDAGWWFVDVGVAGGAGPCEDSAR